MAGIEWSVRIGRLDAGGDAADLIGPVFCEVGGNPGSDHGGSGHGWMAAGRDDADGEEERPGAGDDISAVINGRAKWSGHWGYVRCREWIKVWTEGGFEDVNGIMD